MTLQTARATPEEIEALTKPFNLRAAFEAPQV